MNGLSSFGLKPISFGADNQSAFQSVHRQEVDNVAKGIQAAMVALYIMTARNVDRGCIQEDVFWKVVRLITFQILQNFAPIKDPEQRSEYDHYFKVDTATNPKAKSKGKGKRKKKTTKSTKSRRKQKAENDEIEEFWNELNTMISVIFGEMSSSLLLLMNIYNERECVRTAHITDLLNCCFDSFEYRNFNDIQV